MSSSLTIAAGIAPHLADDSDACASAFEAEMTLAGSPVSAALARHAGRLIARSERLHRHDAALRARRVRHAADEFDEERQARAASLLDGIMLDPANHRRALTAMPEGIDLLLAALGELRLAALGQDGYRWDLRWADRLAMLCGSRPEDAPNRLDDDAPRLVERIDAEMGKLEAHRGTLDLDRIALDRAEAAELALIATDPTAAQLRRYEAATERSLHRTLFELRQVYRRHGHALAPEPLAEPTATADALAASMAHLAEMARLSPTLGSFGREDLAPAGPRDAATITVAKPPARPASRYDDRKKRPKLR